MKIVTTLVYGKCGQFLVVLSVVYLCVDSLVVLSVDSSCTFAWRVWLYLVCLYLCVDNLVVLSG